jgi:hypothetical protein
MQKKRWKVIKTLKAYLKEAGQDENFEEFDVVKLNEVLGHFYMNTRKQDGEHYKATSFQNIRHTLNRHIQGVPYNRKMDIIKDTEFSDANVCFTLPSSFKYALSVLITFHCLFCIYQHFLFFNLVCC